MRRPLVLLMLATLMAGARATDWLEIDGVAGVSRNYLDPSTLRISGQLLTATVRTVNVAPYPYPWDSSKQVTAGIEDLVIACDQNRYMVTHFKDFTGPNGDQLLGEHEGDADAAKWREEKIGLGHNVVVDYLCAHKPHPKGPIPKDQSNV